MPEHIVGPVGDEKAFLVGQQPHVDVVERVDDVIGRDDVRRCAISRSK
jgi:hypothetical protein